MQQQQHPRAAAPARTQVKGAALEHDNIFIVHTCALREDHQRRGACRGSGQGAGVRACGGASESAGDPQPGAGAGWGSPSAPATAALQPRRRPTRAVHVLPHALRHQRAVLGLRRAGQKGQGGGASHAPAAPPQTAATGEHVACPQPHHLSAHLGTVEPEAAERGQVAALQCAHPPRVQLHDGCGGRGRGEATRRGDRASRRAGGTAGGRWRHPPPCTPPHHPHPHAGDLCTARCPAHPQRGCTLPALQNLSWRSGWPPTPAPPAAPAAGRGT